VKNKYVTQAKAGVQNVTGFRLTPAGMTALISRLVVGGVLVYAGFMKAVGPAAEFAASIEGYKILTPGLITPLSLALPWVEMWVGLFILTGYYTRPAAGAAALMFLTFIGAMGSALLRNLNLYSCGCFGYDSFSPHYTILGDILLLSLSLALFFELYKHPRFTLDNWLK
jgi:uncharacterized membrane protein YphA (DoxX/SURF4 family)